MAALNPEDTDGDALTGGYVFRIDSWWHPANGWTSDVYHVDGQPRLTRYQYRSPNAADITAAQQHYIADWMDGFEDALWAASLDEMPAVYAEYLDLGSFVDFLLWQEWARNPTATG